MAKKKEAAHEVDGQDRENSGPRDEDGDQPQRAGGRTIARWKQAVFKELPDGSDEDIAARINQLAQEEGYNYRCSPQAVARWRAAETSQPPITQAQPGGQEEGYAYVVLRQLVHLLGKDAVKKLIDSL